MNKKEIYDKKIEIMKTFLESAGDIDTLKKIQNNEILDNLENDNKDGKTLKKYVINNDVNVK